MRSAYVQIRKSIPAIETTMGEMQRFRCGQVRVGQNSLPEDDRSFASRADAEISIALALNLVYLLSLVLQPFMPTTANEIREQLNAPQAAYVLDNAFRCYLPAGHTIGQARPLFKRVEKSLADEYRLRFNGQQR